MSKGEAEDLFQKEGAAFEAREKKRRRNVLEGLAMDQQAEMDALMRELQREKDRWNGALVDYFGSSATSVIRFLRTTNESASSVYDETSLNQMKFLLVLVNDERVTSIALIFDLRQICQYVPFSRNANEKKVFVLDCTGFLSRVEAERRRHEMAVKLRLQERQLRRENDLSAISHLLAMSRNFDEA